MTIGGAQSVRRAMEVARTVAQLQRSGASLSRVARATGLSTPTTYRLLRSLVEERLLAYSETGRSYHLGPLAFELGLASSPEDRIAPTWRHVVREVARRTRLTSYLIARSGDEAVCLHCVQGSTAIRAMPMEVGQRVPLGIGAGSLAILASLHDREIGRILAAHQGRYGVFPSGKPDLDGIRTRVAETRRRGFSISTGTVASGVTGIGVLARKDGAGIAITVSAVADAFGETEAAGLASLIRKAMGATVTIEQPE